MPTGDWPVGKSATTIYFHTDGRCKFTKLQFEPPNDPKYPPGLSHRVDDRGGKTISYTFDGRQIPGYPFSFTNDDPNDGNGSGVIKN